MLFLSPLGLRKWRLTQEYCHSRGIQVTVYGTLSPLHKGYLAETPELEKLVNQLAVQKQKTASQVLLRWMYEMGRGLITTTSKPERLQVAGNLRLRARILVRNAWRSSASSWARQVAWPYKRRASRPSRGGSYGRLGSLQGTDALGRGQLHRLLCARPRHGSGIWRGAEAPLVLQRVVGNLSSLWRLLFFPLVG